jgi:hypothetical protein
LSKLYELNSCRLCDTVPYTLNLTRRQLLLISLLFTQTHPIQMKNPRQLVPGKYLERSFSQPDHRNRNNNSRNRNRSSLSDYLPRSSTTGYGQSAEGRSVGNSQSAERRSVGNSQSAEGRSVGNSQSAERRSDGYSKSSEERSAGYSQSTEERSAGHYSQSAARTSSGYSQSAEGMSAGFRPSAAGNQNGGFNNQVSPRKSFKCIHIWDKMQLNCWSYSNKPRSGTLNDQWNCLNIIKWNKKNTYLGKLLFKKLLGMSGNGRFFDIGTMLMSYERHAYMNLLYFLHKSFWIRLSLIYTF